MSLQVYWTDKKILEHQPIRKGVNAKSPLRDGIKEWGAPRTMALPDLAELGFSPLTTKAKETVYEIYYRLMLECNGADIKFKWQIALPGTEPYTEEGEERRDCKVELTEERVYELSDATYNPFSRTSPT